MFVKLVGADGVMLYEACTYANAKEGLCGVKYMHTKGSGPR